MNVPVFNVQTTNIYPAANSQAGGQLNTEYNVRSRETVGVGPSGADDHIRYFCGPSYVHSEVDFSLSKYSDTIIQIAPGRALVNGHFIEVLDEDGVLIDIAEIKAKLINQGRDADASKLVGSIGIGLRAMYSTQQTMMSSILTEEATGLFHGIQVVVLPASELKLPEDEPLDETKVTAHIKLGEFSFYNGAIQSGSVINNYPNKCAMMSADRLSDAQSMLDNTYATKTGLDPNKLYIMAGKKDSSTGLVTNESTWCQAQDSLMVFDKNASLGRVAPRYQESAFVRESLDMSGNPVADAKGPVCLVMPHKQCDGIMHDDNGNRLYYPDKYLMIPVAGFGNNTSGVVTGEYTKSIKLIESKINNVYQLTRGKQILYIPVLDSRDDLPPVPVGASAGDYILVGQDNTLGTEIDVETTWLPPAPSTLYVVLPRLVSAVTYKANLTDWSNNSDLTGIRIAEIEVAPPSNQGEESYTEHSTTLDGKTYKYITIDGNNYAQFFSSRVSLEDSEYRGVNKDYIVLTFDYQASDDVYYKQKFFYAVSGTTGGRKYSDPIQLQGQYTFATEETVGGFLNVSESSQYQDAGYVYLDDTGHLRLMDYNLLRSDGLSYQLGQDINLGAGLDLASLQEQLNDLVNERIVFPNAYQALAAMNSNLWDTDRVFADMITVTVTLPEEAGTVVIHGLDSRFGTACKLRILGKATSDTKVQITGCARLRIDPNIEGSPTIELNNCCLYYDASVIDRISTIDNLTLWYDRKFDTIYNSNGSISYTPPNLLIQGNEVITLDPVSNPTTIDFWSATSAINDNHYSYALRSITFDSTGHIVGASIFIRCETTANIQTGLFVSREEFVLPQSISLSYPPSKLTRKLKIDGTFMRMYTTTEETSGSPIFIVVDTKFTAVSNYLSWDSYDSFWRTEPGALYIFMDVKQVGNVTGMDADSGSNLLSSGWHYFSGGYAG